MYRKNLAIAIIALVATLLLATNNLEASTTGSVNALGKRITVTSDVLLNANQITTLQQNIAVLATLKMTQLANYLTVVVNNSTGSVNLIPGVTPGTVSLSQNISPSSSSWLRPKARAHPNLQLTPSLTPMNITTGQKTNLARAISTGRINAVLQVDTGVNLWSSTLNLNRKVTGIRNLTTPSTMKLLTQINLSS